MPFFPGQRLLIRDAEWLLKRVEATPEGETALVVSGISEIVRGREAIFLPRAEGGDENIQILDPAKTTLVPDSGQNFLRTRLHLESQLRRMPPVGNDLWIGYKAAMDVLPFQLDPASQALQKPRQRILIADTVGLGKTLEAGILTAELARRGRARRILVVTMKSILAQFQREWWSRFTLPLVRLDSQGIQRVRNHLPTHANPFHFYDRSIISLDTLKQPKFREYLAHAWWDVIVLDEAHNVAATDGMKLSNDLAELLSSRSDSLIMLSATPHNGRKKSFASLMNMLDPTAIADPENYGPEDIQGMYVRRFRKDVMVDLKANVPERKMLKVTAKASPAEETVFGLLQTLALSSDKAASTGEGKTASGLFRITLLKSFLSSPVACAKTLRHRIERSEKGAVAATEDDLIKLQTLLHAVEAVGEAEFTKYQELLSETLPRGAQVAYSYDAQDRMSHVSFVDPKGITHSIMDTLLYRPTDAPDSLRLGLHMGQKLSYDTSLGLLTGSVLRRDSGTKLVSWSRIYDRAGQVLQDVRPSGETADYTWDNLSRLKGVSYPGGSSSGKANLGYSWSANGVLTGFSHDFGSATWTVPVGSNQSILSASSHDGYVAQGWDWHGNRTRQMRYASVPSDSASLTGDSGSADTNWLEDRRLSFDAEDRLVRAVLIRKDAAVDTTLLGYSFSESGMPAASLRGSVSGSDTSWQLTSHKIYEGSEVIADSGLSGWLYRVGNAEVRQDSTGTWQVVFVTTDPVGTVNGLVGDSGVLLASYQFDAFGNLERYEGRSQTEYQYAGKSWDSDLGLYWMGVRLYDPVAGQFVSRDALEQYRNPYSYTGGSPLDNADAWGLEDNAGQYTSKGVITGGEVDISGHVEAPTPQVAQGQSMDLGEMKITPFHVDAERTANFSLTLDGGHMLVFR